MAELITDNKILKADVTSLQIGQNRVQQTPDTLFSYLRENLRSQVLLLLYFTK
jgi:hypothetical protein